MVVIIETTRHVKCYLLRIHTRAEFGDGAEPIL